MNVKEYISSGIIESYVLGLATEAERQELEHACAQYPEIAQAREAFELSLETTLLRDAVPPPVALKEKIKTSLLQADAPAYTDNPFEEETPVRSMGVWKWIAAASIILLAGAAYWAFHTNNKYQQLQQAHSELQQQYDSNTARLNDLQTDAATLQKPGMKMATLQGTLVSPHSFATVYWDTTSKDVYLMINNLPQPASDKQYQLWALLDGKPVDLGVFEMRQEKLLVKVNQAQNAQAFAITLEPKGGSAQPSLDKMYVMGKL